MYIDEKKHVRQKVGSIMSITTDTWTSIQKVNYMCITDHCIDSEWKLQERVLNFCLITSHMGKDIGKMLDKCLKD